MIIPQPHTYIRKEGYFVLNSNISVCAINCEMRTADYFRNVVKKYGIDVHFCRTMEDQNGRVIFSIDKTLSDLTCEGYKIDITPNQIQITSFDYAGQFYAVQTLRQLMANPFESGSGNSIRLNCISIIDKPRFEWRGLMLDCARHFMTKEFIKKFIETMAFYKFNILHWHLTDDQGWRIEINKYPLLHHKSAWRKSTQIGRPDDMPYVFDNEPHGGFYSQSEILEIIKHARDNFITIVPEIEMPGHCVAALASYPNLSCAQVPFEVGTRWGVYEDVYCAGNEDVFTFLENVLTEVFDLFPGSYVHVGGDEVPKARWDKCQKCQERIQTEKLHGTEELQSYFMNRIIQFATQHKKTVIGWDEIFASSISADTAIMVWRDTDIASKAAQSGHNVVMCPTEYCYLDYYQVSPALYPDEPLAFKNTLPIEKVYSFEPLSNNKTLGVQGNIWTEYIKSPQRFEYMAFPRVCAIAEVAWTSPCNKNFAFFKARLLKSFSHFELMNVNFCRQL